jgi:hypothetical protein
MRSYKKKNGMFFSLKEKKKKKKEKRKTKEKNALAET